MSNHNSYISFLQKGLAVVEEEMMNLLDASTIKQFKNNPNSAFYIVAPEYYWADADALQKSLQMKLLKLYSSWLEHFHLLFDNSPREIRDQIKQTDDFIKSWINKDSSWNIPSTVQEAKAVYKEQTKPFRDLIAMLNDSQNSEVIAVPDTNALVASPDIGQYGSSVGSSKYTVIIVPQVLAELDKLKITHRDNEFRNKVDSVIRRIKGLRTQGSLLEGVIVNKTVSVRMIASEPNFSQTLSWLDPNNEDDRIIASILEIQRNNPNSKVVAITFDINMQNKAEMGGIPYVEPPVSS